MRICAHDFQRHGDAFGTTENAFFRAFITLRSQFHLHYRSQRTLTEIVSILSLPRTLVLSFNLRVATDVLAERSGSLSEPGSIFLNSDLNLLMEFLYFTG